MGEGWSSRLGKFVKVNTTPSFMRIVKIGQIFFIKRSRPDFVLFTLIVAPKIKEFKDMDIDAWEEEEEEEFVSFS